jgi:hypothetical protein
MTIRLARNIWIGFAALAVIAMIPGLILMATGNAPSQTGTVYVILAVGFVLVAFALARVRVTITAEGVLTRESLAKKRVLPFARIRSVVYTGADQSTFMKPLNGKVFIEAKEGKPLFPMVVFNPHLFSRRHRDAFLAAIADGCKKAGNRRAAKQVEQARTQLGAGTHTEA